MAKTEAFKRPTITDAQRKALTGLEPAMRALREDIDALEAAGVDLTEERAELDKAERLSAVLLERFNPRRPRT